MQKILFLDIDGVLNTTHTKETFLGGFRGIEPRFCQLLRKILDETGCDLVISSTWRVDPRFMDHLWDNLNWGYKDKCVGYTPIFWGVDDFAREKEIQMYLDDHPVKHFAILDDMDMDKLKDNHFQTNEAKGLTRAITEKIIKHLNERN